MSDTKEILHQILNDEKLLNSRAFRDRVYKDEPIIRTAAQLKKSVTPSRIKEMKGIAFTPEAYWKTSAWLFYTQGKLMEDYEDDFTFSEDFVKYYPSYRDLSVEQLRGYFTWRTNVRKNIIEKAPLPFVYIYIYELINCIGSDDPAECFTRLKNFCSKYVCFDSSIAKYTDNWLCDMIVYYGLAPELANDIEDISFDIKRLTLIHWPGHSEDELFEAISDLSSYQIKKSLYYTAAPQEFKDVLVRSFVKLSEFFMEKRKNSLCDKLFGNIVECTHNMFASAIFYDRQSLRSCDYRFSEIHSYTCRNGKWKCIKYYGNRGKNGHLGDIVKAVDSLLREKNDFRYKISISGVSKTALKIIQNEINSFYAEKERKKAMKIEIDVSKLANIRKAADITRDKLIVDEGPENMFEDVIEKASDTAAEDHSLLDNNEIRFMRALLYDGDTEQAARSCGKLPSILADSINEKLFDTFSDNVIDFSSDSPQLIEDYTDELRQMIPKE